MSVLFNDGPVPTTLSIGLWHEELDNLQQATRKELDGGEICEDTLNQSFHICHEFQTLGMILENPEIQTQIDLWQKDVEQLFSLCEQLPPQKLSVYYPCCSEESVFYKRKISAIQPEERECAAKRSRVEQDEAATIESLLLLETAPLPLPTVQNVSTEISYTISPETCSKRLLDKKRAENGGSSNFQLTYRDISQLLKTFREGNRFRGGYTGVVRAFQAAGYPLEYKSLYDLENTPPQGKLIGNLHIIKRRIHAIAGFFHLDLKLFSKLLPKDPFKGLYYPPKEFNAEFLTAFITESGFNLSKYIKKFRKTNSLSRENLMKRLHTSEGSLRALERGEPVSLDILRKVVDQFQLSHDFFPQLKEAK